MKKLGILLGIMLLVCVQADAYKGRTSVENVSLVPHPNWSLVDKDYSIDGARLNLLYGINEDLRGVDVGIANQLNGDLSGLQFGGINLVHGYSDGAQLGLYNKSGSVSGIQFGLINKAETVDQGIQIGILNFNNANTVFKVLPFINWNMK